jgi:DNA-binding beta-propeller fold protein YncE
VSDLKDELRQLADDAARQARPLAVADVIRQGDRRHRRTIIPRRRGSPRAPGLARRPRPVRRWPGWVAPLAAAAAVTAVLAVVATVRGAIHGSGSAGHRPAASTVYTVYVAIFGPPADRDGLVPISTATNTPSKPIHVRGMSGVAITPDGKTIYVGTGDTVIPISTATNTPGRPIHFRAEVSTIAVNADGNTTYVEIGARSGPRMLVPVSTATNTPGTAITVGSYPVAIAITP